jgi:hypothetical protein
MDLQSSTRSSRDSVVASDKSQYMVALGGVIAGITIAIIAWLVWSLMVVKQGIHDTTGSQTAIQTNTINELSEKIDHLSEQIVVLTDTISDLEKKVATPIKQPGFSANSASRETETRHGEIQTPVSTQASLDNISSETLIKMDVQTGDGAFVPTHRVIERVNLRPNPSTDRPVIATLKVGSEVQYLRESGDWYFVKTESDGDGWVASEYLSSGLVQ